MYGKRNYITNWKKQCYISSKLESTYDDYGNEIPQYAKPISYKFNIQPVTTSSEAQTFGELAPKMSVAVITEYEKYLNKFKEFDKAYLDGITPTGETVNGEKANYRVYAVQPQNAIIKVYFLKLAKGDEING